MESDVLIQSLDLLPTRQKKWPGKLKLYHSNESFPTETYTQGNELYGV